MDSFGVGCVLAELYIGGPLFYYTADSLERLALLEQIVGPFPLRWVEELGDQAAGMFTIEQVGPCRVPFVTFFRHGLNGDRETRSRVKRTVEALPLTVSSRRTVFIALCTVDKFPSGLYRRRGSLWLVPALDGARPKCSVHYDTSGRQRVSKIWIG